MPVRLGSSDRTILIVAGLLMTALASLAYAIAPTESAPQPPGSTFSSEPAGARAGYLLLQQLGHDIGRSFEPIASLSANPPDTIVVLANPSARPSKGDQQAASSFVHGGGILLAFGLSAAAFLPGAGTALEGRSDAELEAYRAALPGPLTRGVRELSANRRPPPALDPAYVPVYGERGNPAVVTASFGEGRVIWCLDETLVQNEGIARADNVGLIVNAAGIAGARTIAWDEYYHGQRRSFWSYLAGTPLFWGLVQLGLVAVVMLAGTARRRGPLRARQIESRTSPLEFIDTMASLYERAGNARAAVETARDRLRRRLALAAGMATSASDDHLAAAAAPRLGLDPVATRTALAASADALRRGIARGQDAVPLVAELQDLLASAGRR